MARGRRGGSREAWWLNGSVPDCCPAVPGSNPASPQPTADCRSPGGLPPGMALGCGLTSVRGNRGENYENEPLVRQKHIKKKKNNVTHLIFTHSTYCASIIWAVCLDPLVRTYITIFCEHHYDEVYAYAAIICPIIYVIC